MTRSQLAAYGAPALPLAALLLPAYIYLPKFWATDMGLGLSAVGVILLATRIWDMVTDPVIGFASDHWRGRHGRRRPFIAAGMPLVVLAAWMLFCPPAGAGAAWLAGWNLALTLGWTMMMLPLFAWGAELSGDYHERTRITAWREGLGVAGMVLALVLAGSQPDAGAALAAVALLVAIALPAATAWLLLRVPEPPPAPAQNLGGWRAALALMTANLPFRRLILAYLFNGLANGMTSTLFLLFVTFRLGADEAAAGKLLVLYFLVGMLAVPLWTRLAARFGKHRVWCVAMLGACAVFLPTPLLMAGDIGWFALICALSGAAVGADLVLPAAMQADVIDIDTLASGRPRGGLYFALWGMATKLALALAVGIIFPLLDFAGFDPRTGGNGLALALLYALPAIGLKLIAVAIMWNHPLTEGVQAAIRRKIAAVS